MGGWWAGVVRWFGGRGRRGFSDFQAALVQYTKIYTLFVDVAVPSSRIIVIVNKNNIYHSLAQKLMITNPLDILTAQVSKEGDTFEVPVDIAKLSTLVVTTLGEDGDDDDDMVEIPLPNVKATVLAKVIEYCTHYKQVEPSEFE